MDRKTIIDNLDQMEIGVDEPFQFSCRQCGKCCINREDILLSPKDLYNASKALGIEPIAFVEKYGETYIGRNTRMVVVRMRPQGSIKRCPMLKGQKCAIHDSKPAVCAMYPIGRFLKMERRKAKMPTVDDIRYFFNGSHCGNTETHTVREWFSNFGIPLQDPFFIEWQNTICEIHKMVERAEKRFSKQEELLEKMWSVIYSMLYLNYNMNSEFMPQFLDGRQTILKLAEVI